MLKTKVCRLQTSNLVGGWSMRYQLPWPGIKGAVKLCYCTRAEEYRVSRTRWPHNLFNNISTGTVFSKAEFTTGHMLPGNMCPGRATCIRIHNYVDGHMLPDTSCSFGIHVDCISANYYSFMSRSTCIPLYPATDGRQFCCCRYKKHVDGNKCPVNSWLV